RSRTRRSRARTSSRGGSAARRRAPGSRSRWRGQAASGRSPPRWRSFETSPPPKSAYRPHAAAECGLLVPHVPKRRSLVAIATLAKNGADALRCPRGPKPTETSTSGGRSAHENTQPHRVRGGHRLRARRLRDASRVRAGEDRHEAGHEVGHEEGTG